MRVPVVYTEEWWAVWPASALYSLHSIICLSREEAEEVAKTAMENKDILDYRVVQDHPVGGRIEVRRVLRHPDGSAVTRTIPEGRPHV